MSEAVDTEFDRGAVLGACVGGRAASQRCGRCLHEFARHPVVTGSTCGRGATHAGLENTPLNNVQAVSSEDARNQNGARGQPTHQIAEEAAKEQPEARGPDESRRRMANVFVQPISRLALVAHGRVHDEG